jgi:sulfite reductase (NADPH) flavoprotein alpha-component
VHVLYGTETGNAESVADDALASLAGAGVEVRLDDLSDVTPGELAAMGRVVIVCSTTGEGEVPYDVLSFWKELTAPDTPGMAGLRFAVCGLGDSNYDDFCNAGKQLDNRLAELGATRFLDRVDCDFDFEATARAWVESLVEALGGAPAAAVATSEPAPEPTTAPTTAPTTERRQTWDRNRPYRAQLVATRRLSGPASTKDVRHHELALADSGLDYAPGDGIGVVPRNDPDLAAQLLEHLGGNGDDELHARLCHAHEIVTPSQDLLAELVRRTRDENLRAALSSADTRHAVLWGRDTLDLLQLAAVEFELEELLGLLRPLAHRTYSIASSPLVSPDRVHLTVASVRYGAGDRSRGGVCSTDLADRLATGDEAGVFLEPNPTFRLPPDDAPMIMVGPGTGVAPFRAFLQERRERGASGRSWLFFGDRNREHDFLYGDELEAMHAHGALSRLDLAFSRDGAEKVYVQHRMREHGAELHAWLRDGGYFYVCGDERRMAPDVDAALHDVVAEHGGLDADGAAEYVRTLRREKRYRRDVY